MRVTSRNARADASGRHNDRNFAVEKATHIDDERSINNKYYTYNGDYEHTFTEVEYEFYEKNFTKYLEEQNERNIKLGHGYRNKNLTQYLHGRYSRPEDKILQIGDMYEHPQGDELWACAMEYAQKFNEAYGDHCKIIDMALHMDEATPHVHVRRVWIDKDDYGNKCVGQNKALESLGFERPDLTQPVSRFNNAKMPFSEIDRKMFLAICRERGIEFEDTRGKRKTKHLPLEMFKERNPVVERLREMEKQISELEETLECSDNYLDEYTQMLENFLRADEEYMEKIKESKDKERHERIKILNEIYNETIRAAINQTKGDISFETVEATINKEIENRRMVRFMKREGLYNKYQEYLKDKEERHDEREHHRENKDKN